MAKKITLRERLAQIGDGELIYLGSKQGNSFVFIGFKDEFDMIPDLYQHYYDLKEGLIKAKRKKLYSMIGETPYVENDDEKDMIYRNFAKEMGKIARSIDEDERYRREFIPVLDRPVIDEYPRGVYEPGTIIMVSGTEAGRFWFRSEFLTGKVEGEDEN